MGKASRRKRGGAECRATKQSIGTRWFSEQEVIDKMKGAASCLFILDQLGPETHLHRLARRGLADMDAGVIEMGKTLLRVEYENNHAAQAFDFCLKQIAGYRKELEEATACYLSAAMTTAPECRIETLKSTMATTKDWVLKGEWPLDSRESERFALQMQAIECAIAKLETVP